MIEKLINDTTIKAKEKSKTIGQWLLSQELSIGAWREFTENQKDTQKGMCLEALEFATQKDKNLVDQETLTFLVSCLSQDAPKVKWESARTIGNIIGEFPESVERVSKALLTNTKHEGSVVRWATALALSEVLKLKRPSNAILIPTIEKLYNEEEDSGVRKKYEAGLKRVKK